MHKMLQKHVNTKLFFINLITAFFLNLFLEYMERKSAAAVMLFIQDRTFMFVYNTLLIFMILSPVFLTKKKYFFFVILSGLCFLIGLTNGIVLNNRNTPFTAVDLTIAKSTLPILGNYFATWQIILGILGVVVMTFTVVSLYLFSPEYKKEFSLKRGMLLLATIVCVLLLATVYGKRTGILHKKFDNLISGYQEYGVAYCFIVTLCDTGIDRPLDYSREYVTHLMQKVDKTMQKKEKEEVGAEKPNIIFIQLESFFDITKVKGLSFSKDPLPNLHRLQKENISGKLSVPVYGAGTINTEFEVISGMNTDYFGTGEYPYRSILHKTQCDSMAYWMRDQGYISTVLHNNNASFYDRDAVFSNLGFDYFISSENMHIKNVTEVGWAKDAMLESEILQVLHATPQKDYIYTISVQGHGDYPETAVENPEIIVKDPEDEEGHLNQVTYYTNQIFEMDAFIGNLTESLKDFEEEVILIFYGDHLPGLGYESEDISHGIKYETPYVIWDNYGYSCSKKETLSGNVQSWELASKVLSLTSIDNGVLNRYQRVRKNSKNYRKNQKMLQYDLLYGSRFSLGGNEVRTPTQLQFTTRPIYIEQVKSYKEGYLLIGEGFTSASRVYINGIPTKSEVKNDKIILIPESKLSDEDEIVIHQVSKTNENTTLNCGETYVFDSNKVSPLYQSEGKESE